VASTTAIGANRWRFNTLLLPDPLLDIVSALAGAELDDPEVGETMRMERIFLDNRFDVLTTLADRQDNPAISRDLSTRDQEIAGSVILLQEDDVRGHPRVDFGEGCLYESSMTNIRPYQCQKLFRQRDRPLPLV
jgi:hypothetical protein